MVTRDAAVRSARFAPLAAAAGFAPEGSSGRDVDLGPLDRELVDAAIEERLGPLLGHRLKRGELAVADETDGERLLHEHRACTARNVLVERALQPVLSAFEEREVETLVLKGVALVELVFRHPGCRSMSDVDLLVRRRDWGRAREAIEAAGAAPFEEPDRKVTMKLYHEVHAALADGGILDLHRSLSAWPLFAVDHEALFRDSTPGDAGYRIPSVNHLFVCLAMHAAQDGFFVPLRSTVDALALATHADADPGRIAQIATDWKARRATGLWVRSLERFGLPDRFRKAAAAFEDGRRVREGAAAIPRTPPPGDAALRWETRRQVARALDGPVRPVAFFAYRGAAFAADLVLRLLPGS